MQSDKQIRSVDPGAGSRVHSYQACYFFLPFKGTLIRQSNGPLYGNTVIGTVAVDGLTVTFDTAKRGLGELSLRKSDNDAFIMEGCMDAVAVASGDQRRLTESGSALEACSRRARCTNGRVYFTLLYFYHELSKVSGSIS